MFHMLWWVIAFFALTADGSCGFVCPSSQVNSTTVRFPQWYREPLGFSPDEFFSLFLQTGSVHPVIFCLKWENETLFKQTVKAKAFCFTQKLMSWLCWNMTAVSVLQSLFSKILWHRVHKTGHFYPSDLIGFQPFTLLMDSKIPFKIKALINEHLLLNVLTNFFIYLF